MPRKFSSFLFRWWRGEESERLEIEHIQSGRKLLTASIEDSIDWLHDQMNREQKPEDAERGDNIACGRE